jgi:hypothetical protein
LTGLIAVDALRLLRLELRMMKNASEQITCIENDIHLGTFFGVGKRVLRFVIIKQRLATLLRYPFVTPKVP